eukprot:CAMPEP_0114545386 /NCGR_PEP_ID=MMETSP0114-20121206/3371_1 /TAXON_ID=31324 /ORGANISM="Goniomonas sp, Strain m" /LENGTH=68 /DNA_ID=CAMNT_0001729807 /DNA_START=26 /DNA_END=232 /DNA_ORIENTATION=-
MTLWFAVHQGLKGTYVRPLPQGLAFCNNCANTYDNLFKDMDKEHAKSSGMSHDASKDHIYNKTNSGAK